MVQFIERPKSFGAKISEGIGQGLSTGINLASQMALEKYKTDQRMKTIEGIRSGRNRGETSAFSQKIDPEQKKKLFIELKK